ncbi:MAG: hypothetical protein J0L52_06925 [Caulobacterales bacterium]|nr:hypothetical protein [Caulobacterales bacterium]
MSDRNAFDGEIERLFSQSPVLEDAEAFVEQVERRLRRNGRVRAFVLTLAGMIGGFFAVRETLEAGIGSGLAQLSGTYAAVAGIRPSGHLAPLIDGLGIALQHSPSLVAFWIVSATVIVAAGLAGWRVDQA